MNTQVAITHRATETLQAAIAGHVTVPGEVGYDQACQAWNLASDQRPSVVVSAESPTDVVHAVQFAHAHGMRITMPGTLHYHSISCACEQCIRMDERIPNVSPPVTIAFDADELCGYCEFHKFMYVELRCGFSKGHTSKHYDYRHRMEF
jgi:FAD/FMN-containing dehydrogenase